MGDVAKWRLTVSTKEFIQSILYNPCTGLATQKNWYTYYWSWNAEKKMLKKRERENQFYLRAFVHRIAQILINTKSSCFWGAHSDILCAHKSTLINDAVMMVLRFAHLLLWHLLFVWDFESNIIIVAHPVHFP